MAGCLNLGLSFSSSVAFAAGLSAALGGVSETCAVAFAVSISQLARIDIGRRTFIPALSLLDFDFCTSGADGLSRLSKRCRRAARIGPYQIADQNEIRTGCGKFADFRNRRREADARRLEQLGPPLQTLSDRLDRGPMALRIGPAKQHVTRAGFARRHRIMPGCETADAGDAVGFQSAECVLHGVDTAQMRAIGTGTGNQSDMTIEQECH